MDESGMRVNKDTRNDQRLSKQNNIFSFFSLSKRLSEILHFFLQKSKSLLILLASLLQKIQAIPTTVFTALALPVGNAKAKSSTR